MSNTAATHNLSSCLPCRMRFIPTRKEKGKPSNACVHEPLCHVAALQMLRLHHRSIELSQVGKKRERCRTLGSQIKLTCISCNSRSSQRMICCTIRASTLIPSRKETKKRRTRGSRPQLPCNSRLSQVGKKWKKCRTLVHK